MAGTVVVTEELVGNVKKIKFAWTSDGSGAVSGTGGQTTYAYNGACERLVTVPTDGPTDNYDVTILDEDSTDVLLGAGVDRDTTNTEQVGRASLGVVANDKLTLNISGAGSGKNGVVYLYIR